MKKNLEVENESQIPVKILAESIVAISDGMKKLRSTKLNERALILLIQDAIGGRGKVSKIDIKLVLDATEELGKVFLK